MQVSAFDPPASHVQTFMEHAARLDARYRGGEIHAHVPAALNDRDRPLDALVEQFLPTSHAALAAASRSLFFSLPVAFDPTESIGPYLAIVDRDPAGDPYRFLDMGALIATQAFGENDPAVVRAVLDWLHIPFPVEEPGSPKETARREERSLKQLWDLLVSGRLPHADKSRDTFQREMEALDEFLARPGVETCESPAVQAFVQTQRALLTPDVVRRARRVAAVLVEPIQGEGGVRMASARFMRKLRLLTRVYDVPLIFDEVQTGWGMTGRMWAHEHFELPCPPDLVTWAKKAQNGVLFVSEALATFFQEEKKFNTTWEGDSVGMVRLISLLDKLDLEQVRRTGERARNGLIALAREYPEILKHVRGAGVMLGFDVQRADLCDALHDRTFRRGLVLLPAGERTLRFYPRYDTEPYAIDEALSILRAAVEDIVGGRIGADVAPTPKVRVGTLAIPLDTVDVIDLTPATFNAHKLQIMEVEQERYGAAVSYPPDVLRSGQRPLLQYPVETFDATMAYPRAIGVALRDRVSGRFVAYGLGSALENHDEEGVASDPRFGENNTFYLQAMATLPSVQNEVDLENRLLDAIRDRAAAAGFMFFSTLVEDRVRDTGPAWLRGATVLEQVDNYLRSGMRFAYLQASLQPTPTPTS